MFTERAVIDVVEVFQQADGFGCVDANRDWRLLGERRGQCESHSKRPVPDLPKDVFHIQSWLSPTNYLIYG
jgi:hypothetical protein